MKTEKAEKVEKAADKAGDKGEKMSRKIVGVDDGHYAIKVVDEEGRCFSEPSRAQHGKQVAAMIGQSNSEVFYTVKDTDEVFTVGPFLPNPEDTRFNGFPTSSLNLVLVHNALRAAGFGGQQVKIASGLPVNAYFLGNTEQNKVLIEAKQKNLSRPVECGIHAVATIAENVVVAEAIAAYFDSMIDMNGKPTEYYEEFKSSTVGVIDIGGKTTDCAVILPGANAIDMKRTGSSDIGVLTMYDAINARIKAKEDFELPPNKLEKLVRTKTLVAGGEKIDVSDIVEDEMKKLAEKIFSAIHPKIGSGRDLEYILIVGGGALLLKDYMKAHFKHALIPERPEFANARGMLKAAKYVNR